MVTRAEQRQQALMLCYRLVLLAAAGFCWLALLTFDASDWPSPKVYPHPWPPHNLCGSAGALIGYQLFYWFGHGAYVVVLFVTVGTVAAMFRGRVNDPWLRVLGVAFLVAGTAASVRMVAPGSAASLPHGNGGIIGIAAVHFLRLHCSSAGTALIVICSIGIGLLLAAEGLAIRVPQVVGRVGHQAALAADSAMHALATQVAARAEEAAKRRDAEARRAAQNPNTASRDKAQAIAERVSVWDWLWRTRKQDEVDDEADDQPDRREPAAPRKKRNASSPATSETTDRSDQEDTVDGLPVSERTRSEKSGQKADDRKEAPAPSAKEDKAADRPSPERTKPVATNLDDEVAEENVAASKNEPARAPAVMPTEPTVKKHAPTKLTLPEPAPLQLRPYPKGLGTYDLPPLKFLDEPEIGYITQQESVVREKAKILEQTLSEFRLECQVVEIETGPVITMYELSLAPGIKVSQIASLSNDIARSLKAPAVRVVAPIPGKNTIGIEVPNTDKESVRIKELVSLAGNRPAKMHLPLFLGKDASGNPLIADLAKMPHMLIAGTTGSGKSVCLNSIVMSVLMTQRPDMVKMILVDPKMVEMSVFKEVPHLMCPIVTDMAKAELILDWATTKMDERYELLAEAGVRNIAAYNTMTREQLDEIFQPASEEERSKIPYPLPYIIIIIDELADLMMTSAKEVEHHLSRLAQKSRAVGVHIVVATQRPEAKVVTGLIKSNLPCRVAFRVASRMDSRIVLDQNGAEVLMGQGDMLFLPPGSSKLVRAQGTYISDEELKKVITFLSEQTEPEYHPELINIGRVEGSSSGERDPMFDEAVKIIIESGRGSVSLLQRRLTIGYGRASRLIDQMAEAGIVGIYKGSQAREVLMTLEEWEDIKSRQTFGPQLPLSFDEDDDTDAMGAPV